MFVIYVAGPFRAPDGWEVACNVHRAEQAGREVARLGAVPLIPHSIGARMAGTETDSYWIRATLELMRRADAVLGLPLFLPVSDHPDFDSLRDWISDREGASRG